MEMHKMKLFLLSVILLITLSACDDYYIPVIPTPILPEPTIKIERPVKGQLPEPTPTKPSLFDIITPTTEPWFLSPLPTATPDA